MMSSKASLSTSSFLSQTSVESDYALETRPTSVLLTVLSDGSETCQPCYNKRVVLKKSPVFQLEKAQDQAAQRHMIDYTRFSCQENRLNTKLHTQHAAF